MAAVLLLGSCQASPPALPAVVTVVDVTMREYAYGYEAAIPAGRVVLELHNADDVGHELVLLAMEEEFPLTIGEVARTPEQEAFPTVADLPTMEPGGRGVVALDLAPGRYAMICLLDDPDGENHFQKGMSSEFRVG